MFKEDIQQPEDSIDYQKWIKRIAKRWYWILLSTIIGTAIALYIYKSATRVYEFQATIMLKGSPSQLNIFDRDFARTSQLSSFRSEYVSYLNQSIMLGLRSNVHRTVETLDFNVHFFRKSRFNSSEIYPLTPYTVTIDSTHPQALGVDYELIEAPGGALQLKATGKKVVLHDFAAGESIVKYPSIDETITVNTTGLVKTNYCAFHIVKNPAIDSLRNQQLNRLPQSVAQQYEAKMAANTGNDKVFFRFYSNSQLTKGFASIKVEEVEKYATTANVKLRTTLPFKGKAFLNRHLDHWLERELEQKNLQAVKTLHFISQQLVVTQDTLNQLKRRMESFRRNHDVILLEQQLQDLYQDRLTTEDELLKLRTLRQQLLQVKQYVELRSTDAEMIVPEVVGLNSEGLTNAVMKLMELRAKLYPLQLKLKEGNPVYEELKREETTQLGIVREALSQLEKHTNASIQLETQRLKEFIARQNALPALEQEFLELKRTYDLNDKLFNLLRTRKVETEVMKAAAISDTQVLEYTAGGTQVSPKKYILVFGFLGGMALPIAIIVLLSFMDVKINDDEDVHRLTTLPILGHIIRNDLDTPLVSYDHPAAPITETFRALRSSFNYILRGEQPQVILVTSSSAGEGKSFCALNMAGLYAMAGKKTALLGFDLRKHGLNNYLDMHRKAGITDVLIGHKTIDQVVINYRPNLDILMAGSVPPNPSDLIESDATRQFIDSLKERYEYIVIDTSPVGLVTDALPLAAMADINLFVIRPGTSIKKALEPTLYQLEKSGVSRIGLVMNAVDPAERHVSYGYGYSSTT